MSLKSLRSLSNAISNHLRRVSVQEPDGVSRCIIENFATEIEKEFAKDLAPQRWEAGSVRGLLFLPHVFSLVDEDVTDGLSLGRMVAEAIPYATWSEFYTDTAWTESFLASFATGDLVGSSGSYASHSLILGLFLMGPDTFYPAHAHPAEEFYLVISGEGEFQNGADAEFQKKKSGDVILHQSNVSHAIRTGSSVLFAVYGWRGDLAAPGWYSPTMKTTDTDKSFPPFSRPKPLT